MGVNFRNFYSVYCCLNGSLTNLSGIKPHFDEKIPLSNLSFCKISTNKFRSIKFFVLSTTTGCNSFNTYFTLITRLPWQSFACNPIGVPMSMVQVVSFNITKVAPPFDRIDAHASLLRTLLF